MRSGSNNTQIRYVILKNYWEEIKNEKIYIYNNNILKAIHLMPQMLNKYILNILLVTE